MRKRAGAHVRGPYYDKKRDRWQGQLVREDGEVSVVTLGSEAGEIIRGEANIEQARAALAEYDRAKPFRRTTLSEAADAWEAEQVRRGKKQRTRDKRATSIRMMFPDLNMTTAELTGEYFDKQVKRRLAEVLLNAQGNPQLDKEGKPRLVGAETVKGDATSLRTWFRFMRSQNLITKQQLEDLCGVKVEGSGEKGKEQLTIDEGRRYRDAGVAWANEEPTNAGPVVALLPMGCSVDGREIFDREVRDVDDNGTRFIVQRGKSKRRRRSVRIPEWLQPLIARFVVGKKPTDLLFPGETGGPHHNSYGLDWVHRVCERAGVPMVCPHGLRGSLASWAEAEGVNERVVADILGHVSPTVTGAHYTLPDARREGRQRRALAVLDGGKKKTGSG